MSGIALWSSGLSKRYGDTVAVDELDLEVPIGALLGFLGPNGAGKTTAIRLLSTMIEPDAGTFSVLGLPPTDPRALRARIGVLPESAGYPRPQTGLEWLTYHGELFGRSRAEARSVAEHWLTEVGLAERGRSLIGGYSRGMRQRLGIARALLNDPDVLFLDEPTLGLDPGGQRQILDLVSSIVRLRRVTVVFSSHLLGEVEQICDTVIILNKGRVVSSGTVSDVVRRAAAPRTAIVQVTEGSTPRAIQVLSAAGIAASPHADRPATDVFVQLAANEPRELFTSRVLRELVEADVTVTGLTVEGGRLSDAFLALTEEP